MDDHKLQIILSAKDLTQKAFLSASARVQQFTSSVFSMRGALVATAGVAAMGAFVKKSLETADAIGKSADAIGISTGTLQEYRHAARISGVETEALDKSIGQFTKRVGEARAGTGAMITFLKQFDQQLLSNIQKSKSTDEALDLVFKRMGQTASATDKAALANAAFGRSGLTMVNMVKEGAEGLARMRQEARDLGIVIDDQLIRSSERANDELEKLTRVLKVQFMSAVLGAAPEIAKIAENTTDWVKSNQDLSESLIISIRGVGHATKAVAEYGGVWIKTIQAMGLASSGQISFTAALTDGVAALERFNQAYKRYPIGPGTKGWEIYKPSGGGSGGGSGFDKADLAEYKSLMKEVEKAQAEFQNALVIPSGTGALMEEQLRRDVGKYMVVYDSTKEDIEKSKEAYAAMFEDLKFQSVDYYAYRKEQLQAQADSYAEMTGNQLLSRQWLDEQLKELDAQRLEAAGETNHQLIELSQRTADAIEDTFSDLVYDLKDGWKDWQSYFRKLADSMWRITSDIVGQMIKEWLFGAVKTQAAMTLEGAGVTALIAKYYALAAAKAFAGAGFTSPGGLGGAGGWNLPRGGAGGGYGFAKGGTFGPDKYIMVGEEGPELLYTGNNYGRVIPNDQTVNILNHAGQKTSQVNQYSLDIPMTVIAPDDDRRVSLLANRLQSEFEQIARQVLREELR